ncbi:MAG: PA0069 family radical SAM protein [Planctomycetaceae bacterium]
MRHGSQIDPPNRFDKVHATPDLEQVEWDREYLESLSERPVEYLADATRNIVAENDSPDIPFRFSVNPYRGCAHGCSYCYARPGHEYLGFNAGLDFETKIVVKHDAAKLFREWLSHRRGTAEIVTFSGVTDCYQPAERRFRLTRGCLEIALEACQPLSIITKNALVLRDLDLLRPLAEKRLVHVNLSITTLDPELARAMEPRTSIPAARLRAVAELSAAGVPVRVMVAPIIPGLTDSEIPSILKAAAEAGAIQACHTLVRLPLTVAPVFLEWLARTQPLKAAKVESLIRQTKGGSLNRSQWGLRMSGTGPLARQIGDLFATFARRYGLDRKLPPFNVDDFTPPMGNDGQKRLF